LQFFPIPPAPPRIASALAVLPSPATAASSARSAPNSSRPCSRATPPPPASSSPSARASPTWPSPPSPLPRCAAGAAACFVDAHSLLASCSCCLLDDAAWGEAGTGRRRVSLCSPYAALASALALRAPAAMPIRGGRFRLACSRRCRLAPGARPGRRRRRRRRR